MQTIEYTSSSTNQTEELAGRLYREMQKSKQRKIVLLSGRMGAGKTAFARGLSKAFGLTEIVNSPTFTIYNTYSGDPGQFTHIDLYRTSGDADELWELGLDEIIDSSALVACEWWERARSFFAGYAGLCLLVELRDSPPQTAATEELPLAADAEDDLAREPRHVHVAYPLGAEDLL